MICGKRHLGTRDGCLLYFQLLFRVKNGTDIFLDGKKFYGVEKKSRGKKKVNKKFKKKWG